MAIHVGITHTTAYRYDRPVAHAPHVVRLHPAPHARTAILEYRLAVTAPRHRLDWQEDPFGNRVARIVFPEPLDALVLEVELSAAMTVVNPFDFFVEEYAEHYPFRYGEALALELAPYLERTEDGPRLRAWVRGVPRTRRRIVEFLVELNQRLHRDVAYAIRLDPGVQRCEETLARAIGSCRDSAWLLVQILRHLGLAARFASGYLVQLRPDVPSIDGPSGPEKDFTDLHAWAEAYVPGAGWLGLDPTSGLFAGEGHIPLACAPEPASAAPVTGATEPCEVALEHANVVRRVHEDPRVTRPYDEAAWAEIAALGRAVDAELVAADVRLTMGGEPTFVSIDDMDGAEWNTEALGTAKRARAGALVRGLRDAIAPGGLLHFGLGKWYPNEPLPRWALGCHWLPGGPPLWRDPALVAADDVDSGARPEHAHRFGRRLAERLALDTGALAPAFEDWLHYLWREASQPPNLGVLAIAWAPQVRDDLAATLARGLAAPVGWVLPLGWNGGWRSAPWHGDGVRLHLVPGGSPMGLRLPIERVPATALVRGRRVVVPRTALCLEPRDGRLHVFLPPLASFDAYAALVAAVEDTAAELAMPVVLEGYEPPPCEGLRSIRVTPDPGVIEVNVHPAGSWEALEHDVTTLYEVARRVRLGTEKFMLDGRHAGTGGGNHVTLGSSRAADSPFLRRPDLLRSLVTYWQHHPSLSYLFSGLFIGPTSQAPRVDEAGGGLAGELAASLAEIEGGSTSCVIDATLRHLLADVTGNTHRAEFSIDKLWSGDGPAGRQGLVELRAFEMPPHARMSLVQMLLVRALVARFWREPYRHEPVRWGAMLHDRFLLPHWAWADLTEVVAEIAAAGHPVRAEWFAPFFEFRFPLLGRVACDGVTLELRGALEPWHVLGEETMARRQARIVDSACERVQVACRGLDPERFLVACNGRRLPLTPVSAPGELVAGVRFKAWASPRGVHPTIPVHAPLAVDLFDRRLGASVGGFVYHVAHPGGRAYDTFPVNAYEAEARRMARFRSGHTPGMREPPAERPNPRHPTTLDLRRLPLS